MILVVYFLLSINVGNYMPNNFGVYFDNLKYACDSNHYYLYDNFPSTDGSVVFPASKVINSNLHRGFCFYKNKE